MSNKRVSDLNPIDATTISDADLFMVSDVSAVESKRMIASEVKKYVTNDGHITGSITSASYALTASTVTNQWTSSASTLSTRKQVLIQSPYPLTNTPLEIRTLGGVALLVDDYNTTSPIITLNRDALPNIEITNPDDAGFLRLTPYGMIVVGPFGDISISSDFKSYISSAYNFGLGTINPQQKLHVVGDIICNNITGSIFTGTASYALTGSGFSSASYLQFVPGRSNGTASYAISSSYSQNVSVTSSSFASSSISSSVASLSKTSSYLNFTGVANGTASYALFAENSNVINAFVQGGNTFGTSGSLGTKDLQPLQFITSGSLRAIILSNGQVGLGTSSLGSDLLDVNGNTSFGSYNIPFSATIPFVNAQPCTLTLRSGLNTAGSTISKIQFSARKTNGNIHTYGDLYAVIASPDSFHESGYIVFETRQSGSLNEVMRLSESGSVGIGGIDPKTKLHVSGTISASVYSGRYIFSEDGPYIATISADQLTASFASSIIINPSDQITKTTVVEAYGDVKVPLVNVSIPEITASVRLNVHQISPSLFDTTLDKSTCLNFISGAGVTTGYSINGFHLKGGASISGSHTIAAYAEGGVQFYTGSRQIIFYLKTKSDNFSIT